MKIPEEKIEEVRSASDIVDVISSVVALKKRGKNYTGLCPFHQEKTPSFSVSGEKQMFYCFGCGVGGNVFSFIMEHEKVSFVEAVRTLAERAGIALPEEGAAASAQSTEQEALYAACRMAGRYFHENLGTTEGALAREYFRHRGFTEETMRKFGLGYSMHGWDGLIKHAERTGVDAETLVKAGLAVKREEGGGYYDRFRGRAMFPIFTASGRGIAFGARKMREDDPLAKYINSPETPIYVKSRILYGLSHAKEAIREREYAILVEGYADLISVYQAGIQNIVASSGTALTEEQIELLSRYAQRVVLMYDGDSAGSKAAVRGVDLIIERGLEVRVAELPVGEDPDTFVRKQGSAAFQELVDGAVSFLDFKVGIFKAQGLLATPEGKARAVRSIVQTIARIPDELQRGFYIQHLAQQYGLYETVLYRELEHLLERDTRLRQPGRPGGVAAQTERSSAAAPRPLFQPPLPAAERDLLAVLIEHGNDLAHSVFEVLVPEMLTDDRSRCILGVIRRLVDSGHPWEAGTVMDAIDDPLLKPLVADLTFRKYEPGKGWARFGEVPVEGDPWRVAEACIAKLQLQAIDREIAETHRALKEAEGKREPTKQFSSKIAALQAEKKEIEKRRGG